MKKRVVVALGHRALGTTLPEQKEAVNHTSKVIADLIEQGYQVAITHSNAPQVGMIHTAMNEFGKAHQDYTAAPMSVCSAMSSPHMGAPPVPSTVQARYPSGTAANRASRSPSSKAARSSSE